MLLWPFSKGWGRVTECLPTVRLIKKLSYVFGLMHGLSIHDKAGDLRFPGQLDQGLLFLRVGTSITENYLVFQPQIVDGSQDLTAVRAIRENGPENKIL